MPKVSVIIPNYNHAPYLTQRINSVLNQSYQDFELIILDDCSKDNSREVIEVFRNHPRISSIVYNEVNSGSTFKQWEKGIELAKGDYIWIAESDDYCEAILLETLMGGISANPDCTVAYCQSYSIRDKNEIINLSQAGLLEESIKGTEYINKYLIYHSVIRNASMAIFKRETYFTISKDFTGFRFCGDWVFWSEMASRGDVFISGKLLNYFRFHSNDVSTNMYKTGKSFIEQFKCLLLMKQKISISDAIYRKSLSHYTTMYFIQKKHIASEIKNAIEELLNNEENKKHKLFLRKEWLLNRGKRVFEKGFDIISS